MEDDILLTDADFFLKLRCFNRAFGDRYLLMPNRIETMEHQGQLRRFYIDGDYNPSASEAYRRSADQLFCFPHLGEMVRFEQPSNLHSGCFPQPQQARVYAGSGHAAAIDTSFHGPLESAATLGMLKTFQLMKPAPENGRFLTVEHGGAQFHGLGAVTAPWLSVRHLIDWPLTPYTGWGGYGIQLAQALLEQRQYWPRLLACNDRSAFCDLHWLDALQHLEDQSSSRWRKSWLLLKEQACCRSH